MASTEEEREKMKAECSQVSEWLDEEAGPETPLKEFNSRYLELTLFFSIYLISSVQCFGSVNFFNGSGSDSKPKCGSGS